MLLNPNYILIKAGHGDTSYHDTTAEHTSLYRYYVVARDTVGFESAWSNFNTDCGEPMETDCVEATPLNSVPPSVPTGLVVTDAETGAGWT